MRNKFLAAALLAASSVTLAAAPIAVDTAEARTHRVWKCDKNVRQSADTGMVVGALAGGLLGNAVAARGAKTEGAVLGATVGGLTGRQVAKKSAKKNCRWVYYRR